MAYPACLGKISVIWSNLKKNWCNLLYLKSDCHFLCLDLQAAFAFFLNTQQEFQISDPSFTSPKKSPWFLLAISLIFGICNFLFLLYPPLVLFLIFCVKN
jgi:hypothetical protein